MADLRTDYMDDILSAAMGGQRQYKLTFPDGTTQIVKIEDVSEYDQVGSTFGAGDINKTNQEVNLKLNSEDVVDHNLVTKSGFAADALKVKEQFSEQNKKISTIFSFSLTEKVVGEWVDGKKIYQITKHYTFTLENNKTANISNIVNNVDMLIGSKTIAKGSNIGWHELPILHGELPSASIGFITHINQNTHSIQISIRSAGSGVSLNEAYTTFLYTKITDQE